MDNGILPSDEKLDKREKSHIADYNIDEMKMLQCNGARRNLNSSLDSTHNLRTRAKHESGHLLRSKGKTDEEDKGEKVLEKFVVKKRAKGILWIEEEDGSEDSDKDLENVEHVDYDGKPLCNVNSSIRLCEKNGDNISLNGVAVDELNSAECKRKDNASALKETLLEANAKTKLNGYDKREIKRRFSEISHNGEETIFIKREINHVDNDEDNGNVNFDDNDDTNSLYSIASNSRSRQASRRGGRTYQRAKPRLSTEERLIEDNREYYKVEVLGNKLRSSGVPSAKEQQQQHPQVLKSPKKEDSKPSSEKPVTLRFKRVRKSELSRLSDEAESFMFPRRCDESSDDDSIVPKDTESDCRDPNAESSMHLLSSSLLSPVAGVATKQENADEDSQDSISAGRARKKRRTQTEALLKDNTDYYKFENPGSRLR